MVRPAAGRALLALFAALLALFAAPVDARGGLGYNARVAGEDATKFQGFAAKLPPNFNFTHRTSFELMQVAPVNDWPYYTLHAHRAPGARSVDAVELVFLDPRFRVLVAVAPPERSPPPYDTRPTEVWYKGSRVQPGGPKVRIHGCQTEYWWECYVQFHAGGTTAPHLQDVRVTIAQTGIAIDIVRPAINGRLASWLDVTVLIEGRPQWVLSGFLGPLPSRTRWLQ